MCRLKERIASSLWMCDCQIMSRLLASLAVAVSPALKSKLNTLTGAGCVIKQT